MTSQRLTTLVIGYDDVDVALVDLRDLAEVRASHGVGDYEAAIVRKGDAEHMVVSTTVDSRLRGTLLGAGLGLVVGVILSPALANAAIGAGLGAAVGNLADQVNAIRNTDMRELERLVDVSEANLVVIADEATIEQISQAASSRGRRIVVPLAEADVDLLEAELRRAVSLGEPTAI